jgi:hypothetical protein
VGVREGWELVGRLVGKTKGLIVGRLEG